MKPKLHVSVSVQSFSRKLGHIGAALTLCLFSLSVRGEGNTNFVSSDSRVIPGNAVTAARVAPVTGSPGINPASVTTSPLASLSNRMAIGEMDAPVARVLAAPPLLSAQTDPDFALGTRRLVLLEPSPIIMRPQAGETTKGLAVRFFVPNVSVSSPQGGRNVVLDESDRPWAVISAGAATGKSWHEPATYRAQGYLTLHW